MILMTHPNFSEMVAARRPMAIHSRRIALSFSGSGHLHAYQLGAAVHLLNGAGHDWASRITHFAGASGGAIAATVCALLPRERIAEFAEQVSLLSLIHISEPTRPY